MPDQPTDATIVMPPADSAAASSAEPDVLVESDLLVEDVSIDGMCGVY